MRAPTSSADATDASTSSASRFDPSSLHGRLVHGTCGWAAATQRLSIYTSAEAQTGESRLPRYAERFGFVEIDSTTYAVPNPDVVRRWVEATPDGFVFVVKAFGGFCASTVDARSLPRDVREATTSTPSGRVSYASMSPRAKSMLWDRFNQALAPIRDAGKLGCVVFQFHLSQGVSETLKAHVLECRSRLLDGTRVAVEFRDRAWLEGDVGDATARWCREHDLCLVCADELEHETFQRDRDQKGLPPGATRRRMPTRIESTVDWGSLVRVHRRHGTTERVLDEEEIGFWAANLDALRPARGPIWFAWGTEWRDAPLQNARALDAAAGDAWSYDWYGTRRLRPSRAKTKPSAAESAIASLFARAPPPRPRDASSSSSSSIRATNASSSRTIADLWARASRDPK